MIHVLEQILELELTVVVVSVLHGVDRLPELGLDVAEQRARLADVLLL